MVKETASSDRAEACIRLMYALCFDKRHGPPVVTAEHSTLANGIAEYAISQQNPDSRVSAMNGVQSGLTLFKMDSDLFRVMKEVRRKMAKVRSTGVCGSIESHGENLTAAPRRFRGPFGFWSRKPIPVSELP
jgi:hypothetical protein